MSAPVAETDASGDLAQRWGLEPLRGRPKLGTYLAELWERRWFVLELARSRYRAQNEADRLGQAWLIVLPTLNAAVYGLIFGVVLTSSSRPANFVPYLIIGVFMFQFFGACMADGSKAILQNRGLVTSLHFPRAVLPLAVVVQQVLALAWTVASMLLFMLVFGQWPRWSWFMLLPVLAVYAVFNAGVTFIAARATAKVRDVAQLMPFITRIFFYVSGIFYTAHTVGGGAKAASKEAVAACAAKALSHQAAAECGANAAAAAAASHGRSPIALLMEYNPLAGFLQMCRAALIGRSSMAPGWQWHTAFLSAGIWAVLLLVVGFVWFWRAEEEYGRD